MQISVRFHFGRSPEFRASETVNPNRLHSTVCCSGNQMNSTNPKSKIIDILFIVVLQAYGATRNGRTTRKTLKARSVSLPAEDVIVRKRTSLLVSKLPTILLLTPQRALFTSRTLVKEVRW